MNIVESKCKICRRAGEKLYLKGERCYTPKCAMVRKPYAPGIHGNKRGKRGGRQSEFGKQLSEKQRVRFLYGIDERQFRGYVEKALADEHGNVSLALARALESRLDNVIFRLGFAVSRSIARQQIGHGHILVNGKRVTIPSYAVRKGDVVSVKPSARSAGAFLYVETIIKKHQPPVWLAMDAEHLSGTVAGEPVVDELLSAHNIKSIIEFYSR